MPAQRSNYTNVFHALYKITADEGVLAIWKGVGPTVVRAMALNMGMLASYDQSVEFFKDNLGASSISGFFAAACSLPFDFVKIQIQKMQPDATRKYPYTGSLDCAMKTLKARGPFRFYTRFPVYKMGFYGGGSRNRSSMGHVHKMMPPIHLFTEFGGAVHYRPAKDLACSVAKFIQSGGSFINYYMYHGGTNFGRTAGGPFIATSYDYDALLDEFGML
ncbi:unnamed protein product [Lactuca virosa]|uniref:beta-galactosidase n=1 Tax=Lactuca virosa TaxID=75947 RepID=A0AAU9MSJ8_9ASTR|nr:unnamed protein product [Lactuca virosa]